MKPPPAFSLRLFQIRAGLAGASAGTVFFVVCLQPKRGSHALGQVDQWRCTSAAMILSRMCSTEPRP